MLLGEQVFFGERRRAAPRSGRAHGRVLRASSAGSGVSLPFLAAAARIFTRMAPANPNPAGAGT